MKVDVDINEIRDVRAKMLEKINDILSNMNKIKNDIEESKKVYDTPSATAFRDSALEFIYSNKTYIETVLIPFVDHLNTVSACYEETINLISNEVS